MALIYDKDVVTQLKTMPKQDRERLIEALKTVAADLTQRQPFVTELVGEDGFWRLRKGSWRAIFIIVKGDVFVTKVGDRKDVYR